MTDEASSAAPPAETPWQLVTRLKAAGTADADVVEALKAAGVDEGEAKMLVGTAAGLGPPTVPEVHLAPGTNPLAPTRFSLFELGLTGPAHVVGLYWLTFGLTCAALMALFNVLWAAELVDAPSELTRVVSRLAGGAGLVAAVYGAARVVSAVRVTRKPTK